MKSGYIRVNASFQFMIFQRGFPKSRNGKIKKFYLKLNWSKEWNFMLPSKTINFWQTDNVENQWTIVSSKTKVSFWFLTTLQKYLNIFSLYERSQQNIRILQWLGYECPMYIVKRCILNYILQYEFCWNTHLNAEMESTSFKIENNWLFNMRDALF